MSQDKSLDFLCIDTETTGTDPKNNSIIQLSAEYYENGVPVKTFNMKCFPGSGIINLGALKVNKTLLSELSQTESPQLGIAAMPKSPNPTERVSDHKMLTSFVDFVLSLKKDNISLLGHNVGFDVEFLKALFNKYSIEGFDRLFNYRVKDTSVIGQALVDAGLLNVPRFGLGNLSEALGVLVDKSSTHDALYDVRITALSYLKLIELLKGLTTGNTQRSFTTINLG